MVSLRALRGLSRIPAVLGVLAVAAGAVLGSIDPAEASRKKKRAGYSPPYAAMVVDAKTGRVLHAVNENALRHPASITKVMTLWMVFEQLERGRLRMDSELRVSAYAAARPPSKIGLDAGDTITVEDAIKALITKSANDVAVVVAENLAGDEDTFAERMTQRARQLGMSRTVFKNASGLPDPEQVTTARDLTILARALQERFPRYYHLFGTRHFEFAGRNHRNHNRLLGRVEGVDGIKTGFTRASGFNLMTSARADGRHIVSIVLGGRSGRHRDGIMADLVVAHLPRASSGPRTTLVAQLPDNDGDNARGEARAEPRTPARQEARQEARQDSRSETRVERAAPAAPTPPAVRPRIEVVEAQPAARPQARPIDLAAVRPATASMTAQAMAAPQAVAAQAQPMRWAAGAPALGGREIRPPAGVTEAAPAAARAVAQTQQAAASAPRIVVEPAGRQAAAPAPRGVGRADAPRPPANVDFTSSIAKAPEAPAPRAESRPSAQAEARAAVQGWVIQLGATDDEARARVLLDNARARSRSLSEARGFTETVERGGATLFRARFAGFDDQAEANSACRELKRSGFACFATRG